VNAAPHIAIRAARQADAPRMKALGVLGWETTYAAFVSPANRARYLAGDFWSLARLRAVISNAASASFVAEHNDTLVGFATFEPHGTGEDVELTRFYVDPHARRGGAGRALFDAGLAWAHARGARTLLVNVFADNAIGRAFYEKVGFQLTSLAPTTVGDQTVGDAWYTLALT
jgi:ribosomal protein S18 acetylase RimI-like enzyme